MTEPAVIAELKAEGLYDDLKRLSGLGANQAPPPASLPALERLTQRRSLDELHQLLGKLPAAGLGELSALQFLVGKLREQGFGSAHITGWTLAKDCSGQNASPGLGLTGIIRNPAFDTRFGLFFNGQGKNFVFEAPGQSETGSGCLEPKGFNPASHRNRA